MAAVDFKRFNTEAFFYGRLLAASASAYELDAGTIRAQLRHYPSADMSLYEWSTAPLEGQGRISLMPQKAVGVVTFDEQPVAGTSLTLGVTDVTFVSGAATGLQVAIGADLYATLANLLTRLSGSAVADIAAQTYSLLGQRLTIQAKTAGPLGNDVALETTVAGATLSGPRLGGGGTLLMMEAPEPDMGRFVGAYAYDVRFEADPDSPGAGTRAVLFGGTLTFIQGTTRQQA